MNYAERIRELRVYFDCESNVKLERVLGLSSGYINRLENEKEKTNSPVKILFALSSRGISADWFLTGDGPMIKPQKPEEYGTKAQSVNTDNSSIFAFPLSDGQGHYNFGMSLRDYFAGQALVAILAKGNWVGVETPVKAAAAAFSVADAMLKEKEGSV